MGLDILVGILLVLAIIVLTPRIYLPIMIGIATIHGSILGYIKAWKELKDKGIW